MLKRLRRLLAGMPEDDRATVTRTIAALTEAQRAQAARLDHLADLISRRASAKDANEILQALRSTTALVARALPGEGGPGADERALVEFLDAIAKGTRPIIVGPWTGEVGFELLYWVPFVAWFRERWRIDPARLVIVSRGGTDGWYAMPGARYVDIFSLMPPAEFRERTDPHEHKQRTVSGLDESIAAAVQERLGLSDPASLHPRRMYRLFAPYWSDEAGFSLIDRHTLHRRIVPADDAAVTGLPSEYIAARFYFSDAFPDTADNRQLVDRIVYATSEVVPVVVLDPGLRLDDHRDAVQSRSSQIVRIADRMTPERNLATQTAVIARARAFIGTYGGFSYLAPLCGVPSVAFYTERSFKLHHLAAAHRILDGLGLATVIAVDARSANAMHQATAFAEE